MRRFDVPVDPPLYNHDHRFSQGRFKNRFRFIPQVEEQWGGYYRDQGEYDDRRHHEFNHPFGEDWPNR